MTKKSNTGGLCAPSVFIDEITNSDTDSIITTTDGTTSNRVIFNTSDAGSGWNVSSWTTRSIPCDFDKVKTVKDIIKVLKLMGFEHMENTEEAHKFATNEWLKKNAREVSPLGKALNEGTE